MGDGYREPRRTDAPAFAKASLLHVHGQSIRSALLALVMIALGFILYLTASFILEVVVAIMLALLLAPAVNALARLRIPNPAGAGILLIGLLAIIATLGVRLTSPVQRWIETEPGQFLAYLFGRRFSINPVVIFVWVLFWAWMWGGGGLLLAVPMLVAVRICADRIPRLQPLATILARS